VRSSLAAEDASGYRDLEARSKEEAVRLAWTTLAIVLAACAGCSGGGRRARGTPPATEERRTVMFEEDVIRTSAGELKITFIGHGTLMLTCGGKVIHVDPVSGEADYSELPPADIILITHEHGDHLDAEAVEAIRRADTTVVLTERAAATLPGGLVMKNGDSQTVGGLPIRAVPAYNIVHMRSPGTPFHPKGHGNGYVIAFGDTLVYVAGDTENIPEMADLRDIDVAFLPMNLPYTMTPEMAADAARAIRPSILYPYHYGDTDATRLAVLLADEEDIEVRIRQMQ